MTTSIIAYRCPPGAITGREPGSARSMNRWRCVLVPLLATIVSLLLTSGCGTIPSTPPSPEQDLTITLSRIQSLAADGVDVKVAIPTDEDASKYFGVPLAEHDIQPIWLRIENRGSVGLWLMPIAIDPDHYSPNEAAEVTDASLMRAERAANQLRFRQNAINFYTPANSVNEGYVYATHKRGGRFVDIRLISHLKTIRMRFAMLLPTEGFDYEQSALRQRYAVVNDTPDLSIDQLRDRLRELPCCTTNDSGSGTGDPMNIVLVGSGKEVMAALTAGGWNFTEAITLDSIRRMIGAAILEHAFAAAPVSALYAFGRKQDIALQRGRSSISQRNHLRLWLAPFRCEGRPVWVGQVSRDIGVKVTSLSPTFTTHIIDPVVDEAREYLMHSLLHHDSVEKFVFASGVGRSTERSPRRNLTDDPYVTDGMRMVVWLSSRPISPHLARDLGWGASADPSREGRGEEVLVPAQLDP